MLRFLKRKLKNDCGAMDKILVSLLLVIVGVGVVIGITAWLGNITEQAKNDANQTLISTTNDASSN